MAIYTFRMEREEDPKPARNKCEWEGCPNLATETLINFQGVVHKYCKCHASNIIDYIMGMDEARKEDKNWDDPREER